MGAAQKRQADDTRKALDRVMHYREEEKFKNRLPIATSQEEKVIVIE